MMNRKRWAVWIVGAMTACGGNQTGKAGAEGGKDAKDTKQTAKKGNDPEPDPKGKEGNDPEPDPNKGGEGEKAGPRAPVVADTCTNTYPAYWQDPDPKYAAMWRGQEISDQPPEGWSGQVFALSDEYPTEPVDDSGAQGWRDAKYDALFSGTLAPEAKTKLANDYIWEVMHYIQEGNIDSGDVETDWTLCNNKVRNWYHMPFQTYDVLSGREFVHGLTREAPVSFSLANVDGGKTPLATTMWAVGFYNGTGAYTLGTVWKEGKATLPTVNISFQEGTVVGKLLFNTATPEQFPTLEGMPAWTANISATDFCACKAKKKSASCTMAEQSKQCPRSTDNGKVHLLQFDVAVKDSRAPGTGWVFGTFVADGPHNASQSNPWNRISALGLMWGNDTPPHGGHAISFPEDPRKNGFAQEVIFWDVVDRLNEVGGDSIPQQPGHLGCNARLNGPADNANSSCMSCHMTASVRDDNLATPPIIAQFGGITSECVLPDEKDPTKGKDASGANATIQNGITFSEMDGVYFANTPCGNSVNMMAQTPEGPKNVLEGQPVYASGSDTWLSLDYSLQLSISLVQWTEWQQDLEKEKADAEILHTFTATLPGR